VAARRANRSRNSGPVKPLRRDFACALDVQLVQTGPRDLDTICPDRKDAGTKVLTRSSCCSTRPRSITSVQDRESARGRAGVGKHVAGRHRAPNRGEQKTDASR